jgi:hypothetical protein
MGNNLSKFSSTFITSTKVNSCWVRAANGKLKCVSFSVRCGSEGELKEHLKGLRDGNLRAGNYHSVYHRNYTLYFFYTVVKAFKAVRMTIESTQPDQVCIRVVWYSRGYQT